MFVAGSAIIFFSNVPASVNLGYTGGKDVDTNTVITAVCLQLVFELFVDSLCCGYEYSVAGLPIEHVWEEMVSSPLIPIFKDDVEITASGST